MILKLKQNKIVALFVISEEHWQQKIVCHIIFIPEKEMISIFSHSKCKIFLPVDFFSRFLLSTRFYAQLKI